MKIGHIERNYKMTLKEQLEILKEDYEGFSTCMFHARKSTSCMNGKGSVPNGKPLCELSVSLAG